jgi:FkbM family methyltransferase
MALVPPYDEYLSKAFIRLGEYGEAEFEAWSTFLTKDSVVLDVGANFGSHTFHFAEKVEFVYAFEPQLQLFRMLSGSLALQHRTNVAVFNAGAGVEKGVMYCPQYDYLQPNNFGGISLTESVGMAVEIIPIDSLPLMKCDFIKIDVEGMELSVLIGAASTIAKFQPVISAECDRDDQAQELLDHLCDLEYTVYYHNPPLGQLWENIGSRNMLAFPKGYEIPAVLPYCQRLINE